MSPLLRGAVVVLRRLRQASFACGCAILPDAARRLHVTSELRTLLLLLRGLRLDLRCEQRVRYGDRDGGADADAKRQADGGHGEQFDGELRGHLRFLHADRGEHADLVFAFADVEDGEHDEHDRANAQHDDEQRLRECGQVVQRHEARLVLLHVGGRDGVFIAQAIRLDVGDEPVVLRLAVEDIGVAQLRRLRLAGVAACIGDLDRLATGQAQRIERGHRRVDRVRGVARGGGHGASHRHRVLGGVAVDADDGERVGLGIVGDVGDLEGVTDRQVIGVGERLRDDHIAVIVGAVAEHLARIHRERSVGGVRDRLVRRNPDKREVARRHHHAAFAAAGVRHAARMAVAGGLGLLSGLVLFRGRLVLLVCHGAVGIHWFDAVVHGGCRSCLGVIRRCDAVLRFVVFLVVVEGELLAGHRLAHGLHVRAAGLFVAGLRSSRRGRLRSTR